jgi:translation initiation factor eIF-2B subunit alpha
VVISVLQHALQQGKRFNVIVTEAKPGEIGFQTSQILQDANIPVTLILDSAVAFVMDKVDLILVGAEGIVENGGIINKVGTYQISIIAHALSKPFYVASESFKFMRLYPLTQKDITDLKKPKKKYF